MTARSKSPSRPDEAMRCMARRMAEEIDEAVEQNMIRKANRLASNAIRLAAHSTRLADRLARLRLLQNDPEAAMAIVDSCTAQPSSMRLLRNTCLVQLGRVAEAHLDLHEWCSHSTAPLPARRMLALLETANGDDNAATAALKRNLQHVEDPESLQLLTLISVRNGRADQAQHWADRLAAACIVHRGSVDVQLLRESLAFAAEPEQAHAGATPLQIETLALELIASPETLPALVQHQQQAFDSTVAELIYSATAKAIEEMKERAIGFEAMANLARLLGMDDAAIDWIRRGLEANPMSASLALLLAELDPKPTEEPASKIRKKAA